MDDPDLLTIWTVLKTEAGKTDQGVEVSGTGVHVLAGEVLAGVDANGHRHVLIPLRPGEAFADDSRGRSVHLRRIDHGGTHYLSAICIDNALEHVFAQFAVELLHEITSADSPAVATVDALDRWRRLFSDAEREGLSQAAAIGLLAELLTLEHILGHDPSRRLTVWTGPSGNQHDFRAGSLALEVKASLTREGREVKINSVDQLAEPAGGSLVLSHYRFEPSPSGESLAAVIGRIMELGVPPGHLHALLSEAGYHPSHASRYENWLFRVVDHRCYDVQDSTFPRITASSFVGGSVPAGTMRLTYTIDLTNEPPMPLTTDAVAAFVNAIATAA